MLMLPGDAGIQVWASGCPTTLFTAEKTSLTVFMVAATTQEGVLENQGGVVKRDRWGGGLGLLKVSTDAHKVWVGWTGVWQQVPCVSQINSMPGFPPSYAPLQPCLHGWL